MDYTDITDGSADGIGMFDGLMKSINVHLTAEYQKNRLTSTTYGEVYLGAMQSAISQSIQFVLANSLIPSQINEIASRISLTDAQKLETDQNVLLKIAQIVNIGKEGDVLDNTVAKGDYELASLLPEELASIVAKTANVSAQTVKIGKEEDLIDSQIAKSTYEVTNILPQELALSVAQVAKMGKEEDLIDSNISKISYEVSDLMPEEKANITAKTANVSASTIKIGKEEDLIDSTISKASYELTDLLPIQKKTDEAKSIEAEYAVRTEAEKTVDSFTAGNYTGTNIYGSSKLKRDALLYETGYIAPEKRHLLIQQVAKATYEVSDILPTQKDLLTEQAAKTVFERDIAELGRRTEAAKTSFSYDGAFPASTDLATGQNEYILRKLRHEGRLLDHKVKTEAAQTSDGYTVDQTAHTAGSGGFGGVIKNQKDLLINQVEESFRKGQLIALQRRTEAAKTTSSYDGTYPASTNLVAGQNEYILSKLSHEGRLLDHKVKTEAAQTSNGYDANQNAPAAVSFSGVIGSQKALLVAQADGFINKSKQDYLKTLIDGWGIEKSLGDSTANPTSHIGSTNINAVAQAIENNLGV